jgi:hypothetical protein
MAKYRVTMYNGNDRSFYDSLFVYSLEGAIRLLKIKCDRIIDDYQFNGIRMRVAKQGAEAIRIYDINDMFGNYYIVFLKVETED